MYYLNSILFGLISTMSAVGVGLLLFFIRSTRTKFIICESKESKTRSMLDIFTNVAEGVPVLILLILLGQGMQLEVTNHWQEYIGKSLILGLFLFTSLWRYLDASLDAAVNDLYPKQLLMLRISPLKVSFYYVLWRKYMKGFLGSMVWIFSWSIIIDATMGYLSSGVLSKSYVNWFEESIGVYIGKRIGRGEWDWPVTLNILFLIALCIFLFLLSDYLTKNRKTKYNKNKYDDFADYIRISELKMKSGSFELSGADIDIAHNEFALLSGPSGSGKSVFVKSLLEFLPVGRDGVQAKLSIYKTDKILKLHNSLTVMFQEPDLYLYPDITVGDFLTAVNSRLDSNYYLSSSIIDTLRNKMNTKLSYLSAGEKRKLALFITVSKTSSPKNPVMIFDEPDSSLDDQSIKDLARSISGITDKPVIYITHNVVHGLDMIKTMNDKSQRKLSLLKIAKVKSDNSTILSHEIHKDLKPLLALEEKRQAAVMLLRNVQKAQTQLSNMTILKISFPLRLIVDDGIEITAYSNGEKMEDLRVHSGSGVIGIVGENGIGKSTMLRSIMGLIPFEKGPMELDGEVYHRKTITGKVIRKHKISYVYDDIEKALPDKLPLCQIIENLCKVHNKPESALKYYNELSQNQRVQGINDFSGGQRQLIVFDVICHLIEPKLILMDEPFSRLDWNENLIIVLKWLTAKAKYCPIMIVSHNREILDAVSNSIIEIRRKK